MTWVDALNRVRASELGGLKNWRMPKIDELDRVFATGADCPPTRFVTTGSSQAWSASANLDDAMQAWIFDSAFVSQAAKARHRQLFFLLVVIPP